MKIGFFCNEYPPKPHGGIGTFVYMLSQALLRKGFQITIVQFGKQLDESWEAGVRLVTLPESNTRHIAWLLNRLRLWNWIRSEVRALRLDVFEVPDYQGYLPIPVKNCVIAVRLHNTESLIRSAIGLPHQKTYWLEKLTLYWHQNWIGVSQYILEETKNFFKIRAHNAAVIYNPAPIIVENQLPTLSEPPSRYVVYVGSISERKGALKLALAMRSVLQSNPELHLVYVGPETPHDGASISVAILDVLDRFRTRVRFVGQVPNSEALAWIRGSSVLSFVSEIESFGLVVTEAMSLGIPVICSASGPGAEIVVNGESGFLVDTNSSADLSNAISALLENSSLAKQFADAGKQRIEEKFQLESCATQTIKFYQQALNLRNNKNIK
jgi:glycosyltransferase involved in cell wall biosynthesis